jgi:amidase
LRRIGLYDCNGPTLNSICVLNPSVFADALASDDRRASGKPIGPLEGIPFTVKDSYKVKGRTVASGSPAFQDLVASEDAATVDMLRKAGAVLIGKTNMPPMAAGGMQRGLYGRAESPYDLRYLTSAFASGSSNGSAASTAASLAVFGMGEETVSSGRSPASNSGLAAYTPSRGLISIRGNWPLYPTCDVVVPHTRTMRDMFDILNTIVAEDKIKDGDFWREQPFIQLPEISTCRPNSFHELSDPTSLKGKKLAVPKMYIGGTDSSPNARPVTIRPSVLALWQQARSVLESLGATIIPTDFPLLTNYEKDIEKGLIFNVPSAPSDWPLIERGLLVALAWDDFLRSNADPQLPSLKAVRSENIYPSSYLNEVQTKYTEAKNVIHWTKLANYVHESRTSTCLKIPGLGQALKALEEQRKRDLEDWLDVNRLDGLVFPANGDIGLADADVNDESAQHAWSNGVKYSNGNRVLRHLGVPSITVTMGRMEDTKMPVGLTFAGKAYDDQNLLRYAYAFEEASKRREAPPLTPSLDTDVIPISDSGKVLEMSRPTATITSCKKYPSSSAESTTTNLTISGKVVAHINSSLSSLTVYVDGEPVKDEHVKIEGVNWTATVEGKARPAFGEFKTETTVPRDQTMVVVVARGENGRCAGDLRMVD